MPDETEVRAQLQRILASPDFVASDRNRRFLVHVIERTLAGERAGGYEIGSKIFGRGAGFNATADPIMRIDAGKLRRDLETYYLRKSGRRDRLHIALAKGAYRAVFTRRAEPDRQTDAAHGRPMLVRAALLGWAGADRDCAAIWPAVRREYPGLPSDPLVLRDLEDLHGGHEAVCDLLVEGWRRAAAAHWAEASAA